jgi:hypothetical protein
MIRKKNYLILLDSKNIWNSLLKILSSNNSDIFSFWIKKKKIGILFFLSKLNCRKKKKLISREN